MEKCENCQWPLMLGPRGLYCPNCAPPNPEYEPRDEEEPATSERKRHRDVSTGGAGAPSVG